MSWNEYGQMSGIAVKESFHATVCPWEKVLRRSQSLVERGSVASTPRSRRFLGVCSAELFGPVSTGLLGTILLPGAFSSGAAVPRHFLLETFPFLGVYRSWERFTPRKGLLGVFIL